MHGKSKKTLLALLLLAIVPIAAIFSVLGPTLASVTSQTDPIQGDYVLDEILIRFKDISEFPGQEKQYQDEINKLKKVGFVESLGVYVVQVDDLEKNPNAVVNRFKNSKFVDYAEPNFLSKPALAPTDPYYRTYGAGYASWVNAEQGWEIATKSSTPIAVLDSGLNPHPDLPVPKLTYNAVSQNNNITDLSGHGTLVTGTLCGLANNGIGNAGVVWDCNLMFVRISELASGSASHSDMARAITYAADKGAKIISLSYGGVDSVTKKNAVDYAYNKGCVILAATGNESSSSVLTPVVYPGAYNNVLGVGALGSAATRASYSNGGAGLDIMAGGSWYSTNASGSYSAWSGTSCATPVAAGIVALVWDMLPQYTNAQIMQFMKTYAKDIGTPGWDAQTGYGVADMGILLAKARELSGTTPPPAPALSYITANPASLTIEQGSSQTVAVTAVYTDGNQVPVTSGVTLTSNNTGVASVSGLAVRGLALGTATITAAYGGKSISIPVTVKDPPGQKTYSFSYSGKQGASFNNSISVGKSGTATITISGLANNKTTLTVSLKDSYGAQVFSNAFTGNTAKTIQLAAGNYTMTTTVDQTNGNTAFGLGLVVLEGATVPRTAPTVSLVGSKQLVLHLGGSAYVEQGVTATDTVDGNLSAKAVIESSVDTSKAGEYAVKYTVTNSAGLSSSVTRNVSVVAAEKRTVAGKAFAFSPKGKQGESFNYNFSTPAGTVSFTATVPNKTAATVTIANAAGTVVFQERLEANTTRSFVMAEGNYTVKVTLDAANGNSTVGLNFGTPGGEEWVFPRPEVTR